MPSVLNLLIAIKSTELDALASRFKQSKERVRKFADTQPGIWAEQLAQLAALGEYADRLPAEFA